MMATLSEAMGKQKSPLASTLIAGVDALSQDQTITFVQYIRQVLPLDGYVFWIRSDLLSGSALINAGVMNSSMPNQSGSVTLNVAPGSIHYITDMHQEESITLGVNKIIFTSEVEITDLNIINPNVLWLATVGNVRFSFSARGSFYREANLYHYTGTAVYPDLELQIIDNINDFNQTDIICSNSLPYWLLMNTYNPPYAGPFMSPGVTLYPSFLSPANLAPPYATVHIPPESTMSVGTGPIYTDTSSQSQLTQESVVVTLYGTRNVEAQTFLAYVGQFSVDTGVFGIMNKPVVRDEKRTQTELLALSQKKTIAFQINYYQTAARDIARQLILQAVPTYSIVS